MITPFIGSGEQRGQIDYPMVRRLVEWYIASGCVGIFSPCLSSEMYDLTPDERLELARFIKEAVAGRCRVVSTATCVAFFLVAVLLGEAVTQRCSHLQAH